MHKQYSQFEVYKTFLIKAICRNVEQFIFSITYMHFFIVKDKQIARQITNRQIDIYIMHTHMHTYLD